MRTQKRQGRGLTLLAARVKVILLVLFAANPSSGAVGQENAASGQRSHVVDAHVYNGFRRYHAGCNHCHGPDGMGSTIGPSLVDRLPDIDAFRGIVRGGTSNGSSVMQGFASDPNVAPYIDDIYAYLKARANGGLGRGRPVRRDQ